MMLSLVVLIVGAVVYLLLSYPPHPANPPRGPLVVAVKELARIAFFCGLLAYLLQVGGRAVRGL